MMVVVVEEGLQGMDGTANQEVIIPMAMVEMMKVVMHSSQATLDMVVLVRSVVVGAVLALA